MERDDLIELIVELGNMDIVLSSDNMSTHDLMLELESLKYNQRRIDGLRLSDRMGARLVLFDVSDDIKKQISTYFEKVQNYLTIGWWKSAQREINTLEPNLFVNSVLLEEIKASINNYTNESYGI